MKFIISVDDYNSKNIELAKLIQKCGFTPLFFIDLPHNDAIEQAKKLHEMGCELGGHTITHPTEPKLLSGEEIHFQVDGCARLLKSITGKQPEAFAYPRGRHNELLRAKVKEVGFSWARTTLVGFFTEAEDPYQTHTAIHCFPRKEYQGRPWWVLASEQLVKKPEVFHIWLHAKEIYQDSNLFHLKNFLQVAYENLDR